MGAARSVVLPIGAIQSALTRDGTDRSMARMQYKRREARSAVER